MIRLSSWVAMGLALLLAGSGCQSSIRTVADLLPVSLTSVTSTTEPMVAQPVPPTWATVGEGVERISDRFASTTGAELIVYRFDPRLFQFSFEASTSVKRVAEWKASSEPATFAINGVYFHEDQLPSGFLVSHGQRVGGRQFDLEKSGLIEFGSRVRLIDTAKNKIDLASLKDGAQSFPFLIREGQGAVKSDSGLVARRSFIGVDQGGRVYLGILPYAQLSLYELAKKLDVLPIQWTSVLNLDGGPSSGIGFSSPVFTETIDSYVAVPNVILVKRLQKE